MRTQHDGLSPHENMLRGEGTCVQALRFGVRHDGNINRPQARGGRLANRARYLPERPEKTARLLCCVADLPHARALHARSELQQEQAMPRLHALVPPCAERGRWHPCSSEMCGQRKLMIELLELRSSRQALGISMCESSAGSQLSKVQMLLGDWTSSLLFPCSSAASLA